jgi:hypothetical protein
VVDVRPEEPRKAAARVTRSSTAVRSVGSSSRSQEAKALPPPGGVASRKPVMGAQVRVERAKRA